MQQTNLSDFVLSKYVLIDLIIKLIAHYDDNVYFDALEKTLLDFIEDTNKYLKIVRKLFLITLLRKYRFNFNAIINDIYNNNLFTTAKNNQNEINNKNLKINNIITRNEKELYIYFSKIIDID